MVIKNNNIKLSIVIPLHNVKPYIRRAAKSITSQSSETLKAIEIVAVDDGSTDGSLDIFMSYLTHMSIKIIQIKQENSGQSIARNTGIHAATGEYIMFLDADDFLLPDALINIFSALGKSILDKGNSNINTSLKSTLDKITLNENIPTVYTDVLLGTFVCWTPGSGFHGYDNTYKFDLPEDKKERTGYIVNEIPNFTWNVWRYVVKRQLIIDKKLFFIPGKICEDVPWTLQLLENADTISFLPDPFYAYYRKRPDSTMNCRNPKRLIDLNYHIVGLLDQFHDRPEICRQLIWQSFLYINEFCIFGKLQQKHILDSYRTVLPMYGLSDIWLHKLVGRCRNRLLFYLISVGMFCIKCIRSVVHAANQRNRAHIQCSRVPSAMHGEHLEPNPPLS